MEGLLILLAFPLAWPFIAKRIWHTSINYQEMAISIVVVSLLTVGVWQAGRYGQTADTEVWNGKIVSKDRVHDSYVRSYDCNCYTTCTGSGSSRSCTEHCSTCYEDHYTVTWKAQSTVGGIRFKHLDKTTKRVYKEPDPSVYTNCKIGEPASLPKSYTNYVQAVPESLFNTNSDAIQAYATKVPAYPTVHSFYKLNRVINVGSKVGSNIQEMDRLLDEMLITLGYAKQANILMIVTEIDDPSYRYAVEDKWLGGKKNDIVIFVGVDGDKITWTDVMTWALNSGNEMFHVTMRDGLQKVGTFDPAKLAPVIKDTVTKLYDRPEMKDYEYLADDIDPPTWVIILAIVIAIGGSLGMTVLFHYQEVDFLQGTRYRRRKFNRYR